MIKAIIIGGVIVGVIAVICWACLTVSNDEVIHDDK